MADIITNLHPDGDENTNLYPNIKKENIPSKSISTDKLDDNVLSLIGSLKPSGTDASTNILAYTSNKGIYVATDNGHWYYWNGSAYADGGVYQTDPRYDELEEEIVEIANSEIDTTVVNNTGTASSFWYNLPDTIKNKAVANKQFYIKIVEKSGIQADLNNLVWLFIYYSDGTNKNKYITKNDEYIHFNIDENKIVNSISLLIYRGTVSESTETTYKFRVLYSEEFINFKIQSIEDYAKSNIDKIKKSLGILSNADDVIIHSNTDYSFTATSSASWQSGYQIQKDFIPNKNVKKICFKADESNAYGLGFLNVIFYEDIEKSNIIKSKGRYAKDFNNNPYFEIEIPSNTAVFSVNLCLISAFNDTNPAPIAGDVAYLKNFMMYYDSISLNHDIVIPQIEKMDTSSIYILQDDWKNKIQTIQNAQNGKFTFIVQTDTHFGEVGTGIYADQYKDLINNISKMTEYIGVDFIANLGDIIRGYESDTTEDMRKAYTEIMHRYVSNLHAPLLVTIGNHDTNIMYAQSMNDPSLQISKNEIYSRVIPFVKNSVRNAVFNGKSLYYYVDFEDVRVIVLNTTDGEYSSSAIGDVYTISNEQLEWFTNVALNTNKDVMIMCHVPLVSDLTNNVVNNRDGVINALKTYKQQGKNVIGCFYGHVHSQTSKTVDGILHVCFTLGGHCAEIVMIDTGNKTISTIGISTDTANKTLQDRDFSYE